MVFFFNLCQNDIKLRLTVNVRQTIGTSQQPLEGPVGPVCGPVGPLREPLVAVLEMVRTMALVVTGQTALLGTTLL